MILVWESHFYKKLRKFTIKTSLSTILIEKDGTQHFSQHIFIWKTGRSAITHRKKKHFSLISLCNFLALSHMEGESTNFHEKKQPLNFRELSHIKRRNLPALFHWKTSILRFFSEKPVSLSFSMEGNYSLPHLTNTISQSSY